MGKDLGGFAEGVKPFMDLNMALFKEQIKRFHEAIAALSNLPKFGYNQKNTMREVLKLSDIQFKQENVGQELQLVGTGVGFTKSRGKELGSICLPGPCRLICMCLISIHFFLHAYSTLT